MGKVSFMLYLMHLTILNILGPRIARMLGVGFEDESESWWDDRLLVPDIGPIGMGLRFWLSLAIILPISLVFADIGTRLLDKPSVKLGKFLVQKLGLDAGCYVNNRATLLEDVVYMPVPRTD